MSYIQDAQADAGRFVENAEKFSDVLTNRTICPIMWYISMSNFCERSMIMLNKDAEKKWTWKEYTIAALAVFLAAAIVLNIVSVLKMKKAESAIPEVTPIGEPVEVEVSPEITLSASLIAEKLKDVGELVSTSTVKSNNCIVSTSICTEMTFKTFCSFFVFKCCSCTGRTEQWVSRTLKTFFCITTKQQCFFYVSVYHKRSNTT